MSEQLFGMLPEAMGGTPPPRPQPQTIGMEEYLETPEGVPQATQPPAGLPVQAGEPIPTAPPTYGEKGQSIIDQMRERKRQREQAEQGGIVRQ